jgi:hypothetical protein
MITKLSKILVVFVTAVSLAFAGFAIAVTNSGPNWVTESQTLSDYEFTVSSGEQPTWSAKHRTSDKPVKSSRLHPEVIAAAYDEATNKLKEETEKVSAQIPLLEDNIKKSEARIVEDQAGLKARREQLLKLLDSVHQQIATVSQEMKKANEENIKLRSIAEQLRSDVFRLVRNYQAIEADYYQLIQQKRRLLDMIYQMEGLRNRLDERAEDLVQQGAKDVE